MIPPRTMPESAQRKVKWDFLRNALYSDYYREKVVHRGSHFNVKGWTCEEDSRLWRTLKQVDAIMYQHNQISLFNLTRRK